MIGHALGAAGGLEAIATIKAITTGWLHPTINQDVRTSLLPLTHPSSSIFVLSNTLCFPQNLEPDVTIDTVPNVKKQHEVNVGM